MTYQVDLAVFQGPFDLLLELIARRKVDVSEVDLADITGEFVASLSGIDELELEDATHFLLVAATLVELKAARLLPDEQREELEDSLGELRDLLYARLLEYRAFRDIAGILADRFERNAAYHDRRAVLEPRFRRVVPDTKLHIEPATLAALAAGLLNRPQPHVDVTHIRREFMTVREAAESVLALLPDRGARATFTELVGGRTRSDRIVYFLALLELHKLGRLALEQQDHRGALAIKRVEVGADMNGLHALDEWAGDPDDDAGEHDDAEGGMADATGNTATGGGAGAPPADAVGLPVQQADAVGPRTGA